ncbi:hypothetical protein [Zavarzinia sp.]|uniref:hypothetical protein n=1 Tax=Zavarzinia sp. TaxID=2027920 RepID=UPI0035659300
MKKPTPAARAIFQSFARLHPERQAAVLLLCAMSHLARQKVSRQTIGVSDTGKPPITMIIVMAKGSDAELVRRRLKA